MQEDALTSTSTGPGFVSYDTDRESQEGAPQRVWILAGGDSVERHLSLAGGLNVWHQLRKQRDIKVAGGSCFGIRCAPVSSSYCMPAIILHS